jgi:hypothetical protein
VFSIVVWQAVHRCFDLLDHGGFKRRELCNTRSGLSPRDIASRDHVSNRKEVTMIQLQGVGKRITALFVMSVVWALLVAGLYSVLA